LLMSLSVEVLCIQDVFRKESLVKRTFTRILKPGLDFSVPESGLLKSPMVDHKDLEKGRSLLVPYK
jgi:hypothetical protein